MLYAFYSVQLYKRKEHLFCHLSWKHRIQSNADGVGKEKLNLFMRGQDTDLDDIYERFGVDYDLLSVLMSREMDENGKMYLKWGEQNIA